MQPIDYGRSFIFGKWPYNSVRFWVESRTRVIDERTGAVEDYYQVGSCKSEYTFAEKNLFKEDNYDVIPVFGPEYGILFRRHAYLNANYKTCMRAEDMWEGQRYRLVEPRAARLLETNEDIRRATMDGVPLVAQTELWNEQLSLRAMIEHPVKTMNINSERNIYQTDTGPVLLPDLSKRYDRTVDALQLAFEAFNVPHFADFVVEQPTAIRQEGRDIGHVYHYSAPISLPAANRLFALA